MRRNLLATTALTASSTLVTAGAVLAADMAVKAPPPAPPPAPLSWTGCYIGANAGGAWTQLDNSVTTAPPYHRASIESGGNASSFTGGGQLGCNWQFNTNWVGGLEGDINYLHASRTQHNNFLFSGEDTVTTTTVRWLSTIRGRLGYAWGASLLYATGGLALGGVNSSVALTEAGKPTIFAGSDSTTRTGWTVGAGYEYKFNDRLSGKLEYLHFDLGDLNYNVPRVDAAAACCSPWAASAKVTGDIVRLGVNYKFSQ